MDDKEDLKKLIRLGNCEVCGSNAAVYTCPRCELKTCSVNCIKIHKKELECSGDRDKTGFVPISKFNNLTLLSDYRLLEDVSRTIDNCRRNPLKKYTRFKRQLPVHLFRLKNEALRRKILIQYLPQHFTRHKENTTFLNFENKVIYWKIELIFPQSDNIKTVFEKCDENERLSSVISKFVDYDNCPDLYKKSLKFYHSMGLSGVEVLLKAENVQTQPSFFLLDKSSTLKENFENRIIVEYPVLYVIYKSHKDEYTILDSDVELDLNIEKNFKGGRRFIDFTPFSYFDTISYTKKQTKGDKAIKSINSSVAELRKYFSANGSDDDDYDVDIKIKQEVEDFKSESEIKIKKEFNIPSYEDLIKQYS